MAPGLLALPFRRALRGCSPVRRDVVDAVAVPEPWAAARREVGGGEKKRSGTYDFFVGLRRSAFFWRLAAPLVIDYARFLTKINALDTQLEKELEKAQHGGGDEGLEADVKSLRGRMRAGFRRGPGAAADGRRVGREWTRAINEVRAKASHRLAEGFVIEKKWIDEATQTFTRELDFADEAKNLRDLRAAVEAWRARARPLPPQGHRRDPVRPRRRTRRRRASDGDEAAAPPPAAGALRRLADWLAYAADRGGDFLPLLKAFLAMQRVRLAAKIRRWSPWSASSPAAAAAFDARLVVDRLVYAVGRCILLDGIFSADPHPGNVLVRENNELGLIDMGCVYRLADGERRDVALALLAIGAGDADALGTLYARITGLELRTFDARARVYAAVAVFALSHFDFSPVFPGEPLIKTLQRPEFKPKRAIQCQWLPLVQRCTEILRGDCLELGIRIRLCDAWRDLALECLATTTDGDDAHRTWPGGRDKRSELYRGDNPSVPAGLGGDAAPRAKPWRPWRRRRATRAAVDEEVKEEDPHHIEEKVLF
ncbi:hypothetical protein JL721_9826 [Aureococcus anophagefferens]|nr:hypothetical protein JL721_9826 [Aureococcus anophagefferens]